MPTLPLFAYWTHDLNPVIFHIAGPLAIRWYGLAYLMGFLSAYLILLRMSKHHEFFVPAQDLGGFMVNLAIYGVFLGGRIGYVVLYAWDTFFHDPLFLLRVWEGGMASHGGMIGVLAVLLWTARKYKISFWNLTDALALVAPIGLFLGRIANFINGELWGRPTQLAWAVIFPQAGDTLPTPRHPSQLYEALGEGVLLFAALWLARRTNWGRSEGSVSALFLIIYGLARIASEFFRTPDAGYELYLGWLTKGQLYSSFMIIGGIVLLVINATRRRATAQN